MNSFSWWVFMTFFVLHLVSVGISLENVGKTETKNHKISGVFINLISSVIMGLAIYYA